MDLIGKTDAYVTAWLSTDPSNKLKTPVIKDDLNPTWNFSGTFPINIIRI